MDKLNVKEILESVDDGTRNVSNRNHFYVALLVLFFFAMISFGVYWYKIQPSLKTYNISQEQIELVKKRNQDDSLLDRRVIDHQNAKVIRQFVTLKCEVVQTNDN